MPECGDSLLVLVGQREFKDSDIAATRKIGAAVKCLNSSQKYDNITKCYSEQTYVVHKKDTVNCNAL